MVSLQQTLPTQAESKMRFSNSNECLQLHLAEPATIQLTSLPTLKSLNANENGEFQEIPLKVFVNGIELETSRLELMQHQAHQIHMTTETLNKTIKGHFHGVVLLDIHGMWH